MPHGYRRYAAIAAASVILAAAGPAYAQLRDWRVNPLPASIAAPAVAAPWQPAAAGTALWQPRINAPDRAFRDAFGDGGATVMRYVALYRTGGLHDNLVRGLNEVADPELWSTASRGTASIHVAGRAITVASTELEQGGHRLLVWSFYVLGDRILASPMQAKLAELKGLIGGRSLAAFVAIATVETGHAADAQRTLGAFLDGMSPLEPYLDALARR